MTTKTFVVAHSIHIHVTNSYSKCFNKGTSFLLAFLVMTGGTLPMDRPPTLRTICVKINGWCKCSSISIVQPLSPQQYLDALLIIFSRYLLEILKRDIEGWEQHHIVFTWIPSSFSTSLIPRNEFTMTYSVSICLTFISTSIDNILRIIGPSNSCHTPHSSEFLFITTHKLIVLINNRMKSVCGKCNWTILMWRVQSLTPTHHLPSTQPTHW